MHVAHAQRQYAIARAKLAAVRRPHPMQHKRARFARDCLWWRAYLRDLKSRVTGTMHTETGAYSFFAHSRADVLAHFTRTVQAWHGPNATLRKLGNQPKGNPADSETYSIYPSKWGKTAPRVLIIWTKQP